MICRLEALALCVLLAAPTGSAAVDTPPSKCLYTVCNTIEGGRIVATTRLTCDQDCPGVNRSLPGGGATRWRDVQNEIDTVSLAQQAARRNAEAFARVLGELSADQRLFAEGTLSPGARGSIAAAMEELTRRLDGIAASNGELQRRVARLQSNDARLSAELMALQEQRRALLSATTHISGSVAQIEARIAELEKRVSFARADLEGAREFARGATLAANAARREYWDGMGKLFNRQALGAPRDFLPEISPGAPTTMRRILRRKEVLFPQPVPISPVPFVATARPIFPVATAVAVRVQPATDAARLDVSLAQLRSGMTYTERLQREALALSQSSTRSIEQLDREARSVTNLTQQERDLRFLEAAAAERASRLGFELWSVTSGVRGQLEAGLRGLREQAYWELSSTLLKAALADSTGVGVLHNYAQYVTQAFGSVLTDVGTAANILGGNPSDEALEQYGRLASLDTHTARDLAMTMMFSSADELPAPRRANYTVVREAGKPHTFVSPSGLHIPWTPVAIGEVRPLQRKSYENRVLHLIEHSNESFTRLTRESPDAAYYYAVTKAKHDPHSLFDGGPKEALVLVDEAWERVKKLDIKPIKQANGNLRYDVPMQRQIGSILHWGPEQRTEHRSELVRLVLDPDGRYLVTAAPY